MSNIKDYILWIGSPLDLKQAETLVNTSTAAVRWQSGLASGILANNQEIFSIFKPTDPAWPFGPFISGKNTIHFLKGATGVSVRFLNFPKIRSALIRKAYLKAFKTIKEKQGPPKSIIFFNITLQNVVLFDLAKKLKIPTAIIAADIPPESSRDHSEYMRCADLADCIIYLSNSEFLASKNKNKTLLSGGIHKAQIDERLSAPPTISSDPYFLYTGAFHGYCGVELLIETFRISEAFKLIICGRCRNSVLLDKINATKNIVYKGFVSEEALEELSKNTLGFINSYLPSAPETRGKFPSKLFEYLSYGHPIISTRTNGIPPEFNNILHLLENETPNSMKKQLTTVYNLSQQERDEHFRKCKAFLLGKTWEQQSLSLIKSFDMIFS